MKKFIIILLLIIVFCVGCALGIFEDNMNVVKSSDCLLNITSKWDSYVGVAGNELNGGETSHCFKILKNGDYIDYAYKKNGDSNITYLSDIKLKDDHVTFNIYSRGKLVEENVNLKYGDSYSFDLGFADDGPHIIDEIVFNKKK